MQYLKLENVSKSYGEKVLFDKLNFTISKGQKIALIARNGTGKSTLLRVIAGEESPEGETAKIQFNKEISTIFLKQEPKFDSGLNVLEAIYNSDNPTIQTLKAYQTAIEQKDEQKIQELILKIDNLKAWGLDSKIKETLSKLNINDLSQPISLLSGGQLKRVALARIIIEEPEFLILDEPTNHLDLDMVEWLEEYLSNDKITLLMVTHDRYFLEEVCNEIIEIDNGNLYSYRGSYSDYLEKKAARIANDAVRQDKLKQLYKKELDWVRRMPSGRGTKAKSRVQKFDEIKSDYRSFNKEDEMKIHVQASRLGGKILEAHNISKSFGDIKIIDDFSYKFRKGERLGIVGPNGAGKSTFIKMLTKELRPDSGKIVVGETVNFGYYNQDGLSMGQDQRVIDVVREVAEYIPLDSGKKLTAEQLLERFLFPRPQQQVYVSKLSGGERRRLYLLTVLMANPNFLILDEPTNDLDIITLNILEDYLMTFQGCYIIISHDRFLLDKLVEHLFILDGKGNVKDYNGKYSEYRILQKQKAIESTRETSVKTKPETNSYEDQKEQKKLKNKVNNLEKKIANLEEEKKTLENKFLDPNLDLETIQEYSKKLEEIKNSIEEMEMEWMELSEQMG